MVIFKRIDIDMEKERARVERVFEGRQKDALIQLYNLFEAGKWQECLDLVNDEKVFGYDEKGEYPEVEHIGLAISDVLTKLGYENFYTQEDLLKQAEKTITERKKKKPEFSAEQFTIPFAN